ncbi:54S ribosomal protein yml6, mitochondrial [Diatrype stigma]|uniref:Large ribosomal subunit protein uL4m n=1 Tax=Diatrype stigma TaxID=117547 RepID=A0AAN9YRB4_9PEZI
MATERPLPRKNITTSVFDPPPTAGAELWRPATTVPLTIFGFPSHEPQRLESWSAKHLNLPLRRDILHLAVVYEGDNTRQGTAQAKTRWEVHGTHKKLYPQKGSGRARVGTKQSPIRRGGGKIHGPRARDFGTRLPRKVYDLAWRTALSYRYRRGELVVCEDGMELPLPDEFAALVASGRLGSTPDARRHKRAGDVAGDLEKAFKAKWARQVLDANEWGRSAGRSTFITAARTQHLYGALQLLPRYGTALDVDDVDVKDLLETGRLVIERAALMEMIERHQSDLVSRIYVTNAALSKENQSGEVLVG